MILSSPTSNMQRPNVKISSVSGRLESCSMSPATPFTFNSPGNSQLSSVSNQNILTTILEGSRNQSVLAKSVEHLEKTKVDLKNYSLQDWREYSVMRFSDNKRFQRSPHGRRIIIANALREYGKDVKTLVSYVDEMERLAKDTESKYNEERELRQLSEDMV